MKSLDALAVLALTVGLLRPASPARAQESAFEAEVQAVAGRHATDFQKASALAAAGDVGPANRQLVALADEDKSPAVAFLVANLLYKMDPQASYDLHKRAYEAKPEERGTVLEWAMERHRRGEYAEAIPLYQKFVAASAGADQYNALLAECLVRGGKLKEAVAAWEAARHPQRHTGIDFAVCEIHGGLSPVRRRGDLLDRLKKGERGAGERLIDLDLKADQDWWNSRVDKDALARDLPLVEKALGKDSARYREIECWADIASKEEPTPEAVGEALTKAGLLIGAGRLPESSFVAGRLVGIVLEHKADARERLFQRFEKELTARAKSEGGDAEAQNILCGLSVGEGTQDRLAAYDRYGWERYGEERFAGSLLIGLAAQGKLKGDDPELKKALAQFPESSVIGKVAVQSIGTQNVSKEMLTAAICSECHKLSPGLGGYPDSYALKAYFFLLKQKL